MPSPLAEKAILEAQQHGKAILKFISANDAGLTGSHQAGFYLPKPAWRLYSPHPPVKGRKDKSKVKIVWQADQTTDSVVTWYGQKTRDEYRLTCFGKGFPYLNDDTVGDLLVLIPQSLHTFLAYIIDLPDDIDDIQVALGVEVIGTWAIYDIEQKEQELSEEDCIDRQFRAFAGGLKDFPPMCQFPEKAREALLACARGFAKKPADDRLLTLMQTESRLFRLVERQMCNKQVNRFFDDIDDFVKTAASIMNRRRSRPSRSMESHVKYLLNDAKVPFEVHRLADADPVLVIPGRTELADMNYPTDKVFVVAVRNTCKGRWWQITQDSERIPWKHIITMQEGISATQLGQMHESKVALVVPKKLHSRYPKVKGVSLLNVEGFIKTVKRKLA
jgi:type II restriction enzyme